MDKVQKIYEVVEKLKSQLLRGACSSQIAMKTRCKEEAYNEVLAILDTMQEEPVSNPTPNKKMSVERWKKACEAACCDINYRSHYGLTETRDDYFVDGVQWADENPKKEPVKRTPADIEAAMQEVEEKSRVFTEAHKGEDADTILAQMRGEEPVSEDLEVASKEWLSSQLDKSYANYGETKMMELTHFDGYAMLDAIEFGAKWKQEQFEKNRLAACDAQTEEEAQIERNFVTGIIEKEHRQPTFDDAIKYGMRLQKEQMMAEAIDARCFGFQDAALFSFRLPASNYLVGSEVKVIVIKEI